SAYSATAPGHRRPPLRHRHALAPRRLGDLRGCPGERAQGERDPAAPPQRLLRRRLLLLRDSAPPLSCPDAFSLDAGGKLVGDRRVRRLERDCCSSSHNVNGFQGLSAVPSALNSNHNNESWNASNKPEERSTKMRSKDCQLMGLTWLLAKNRTAYIHTVSAVLRAIMMNNDDGVDSQQHSCALNRDGMPLAVDSYEIQSSSPSITHEKTSCSGIISIVALLSLLNLVLAGFSV
ncbi:unnamed protein product, partial [Linum tenue]